ncbi:MAG: HlyD family efflux transporter periplasmic adaptor subunit [Planctomycetes bacterium]|nr:HlyD family efflux transporter periplasmic adaptor subunit [Planctomycetota bacterium]
MNSKPFTTLAWILVLAAAGAGVWWSLRPAAAPCEVSTIDHGPLLVTADEDGRTRLKDRYVVSAPLAGRCERITLKPGDAVIAGATVLARIAPTDPTLLDERTRAQAEARLRAAESAVLKAEPEVARAQEELDHLEAESKRVRSAAEAGGSNVHELEDELIMVRSGEHARDAAKFALQMAKFEVEMARAALMQRTDESPSGSVFEIRSPISGRALRVMHESAGVVSSGDELLEVGSPDNLEVELDVLSDQAVKVRPGQRVSLERWGGEKPLSGIVRVVEPSGFMKVSALGVEEQRVNVIVDFLDPPAARPTLGDNFRVEARIAVWETPDAVRVPVGALFRHGEGWAVYVVQAGFASTRPVEIGQRTSREAQVLSGLKVGETVIVFPSDRIADGARVRVRSGALN